MLLGEVTVRSNKSLEPASAGHRCLRLSFNVRWRS